MQDYLRLSYFSLLLSNVKCGKVVCVCKYASGRKKACKTTYGSDGKVILVYCYQMWNVGKWFPYENMLSGEI